MQQSYSMIFFFLQVSTKLFYQTRNSLGVGGIITKVLLLPVNNKVSRNLKMSCQKPDKKKLQLSCISLLEGTKCVFLHMCFKYIQQINFYSLIPINALEPQTQSKLCLCIKCKCSFKKSI